MNGALLAGDDLREQVVTAREYSGGQGRYLPPRGPRPMPEQSVHYQTMPFCQQSQEGGKAKSSKSRPLKQPNQPPFRIGQSRRTIFT